MSGSIHFPLDSMAIIRVFLYVKLNDDSTSYFQVPPILTSYKIKILSLMSDTRSLQISDRNGIMSIPFIMCTYWTLKFLY